MPKPDPAGSHTTRRRFRRVEQHVRKQDLIRATLDCVAEKGLQAATVREVAVRAGVTNGLIRHYFACKDQMIYEAYRVTMQEMIVMARSAASAAQSPRDRLRIFIEANLTEPVLDIRRLTLWASFISRIHVDVTMAEIHREGYLGYCREFEAMLGDVLREAGRASSPDLCRRYAIKLNAIIDGLWLEGCLASELFQGDALAAIGIEAAEAVLGLSLREKLVEPQRLRAVAGE
ncbi:TetR family transcriptional regulator C-terminal domain-containing protein [Rhodoligotrophos defluvii]|uniref:TetR family transcriptional regulator C-terminal domain-containing protein n=1 Tax=Rhodoligotrophos defluvii TaxID=2561934 RepID=UPI0010C9C0B9|nr:TetR family transcriptional regulator C-terminal domain-containing protein [Rhodoligotrophos defluvii]